RRRSLSTSDLVNDNPDQISEHGVIRVGQGGLVAGENLRKVVSCAHVLHAPAAGTRSDKQVSAPSALWNSESSSAATSRPWRRSRSAVAGAPAETSTRRPIASTFAPSGSSTHTVSTAEGANQAGSTRPS